MPFLLVQGLDLPCVVDISDYERVLDIKQELFERASVPVSEQRLVLGSRELHDDDPLDSSLHGAVVDLRLRVVGGGGDGGSIPGRADLVVEKDKEITADQWTCGLTKEDVWSQCAYSQEPLRDPVVVCDLGYLYNKEDVVAALLERMQNRKKRLPTQFSHVRSLKDLYPVKLHFSEDEIQKKESTSACLTSEARTASWNPLFSCPVLGMTASGKHRFLVMRPCGCVLSERALKNIPMEDSKCLSCATPCDMSLQIVVHPTDATERDTMRARMEERRASEKPSEKKKKKKKRKEKQANDKTAPSQKKGKHEELKDKNRAFKSLFEDELKTVRIRPASFFDR